MKTTNTNKILVGGAIIAFVAAKIYQAKQFSKSYHVSVKQVKLNWAKTKGAVFTKIYFDLFLQITNPSNLTGQLNSAKVKLSVNSNNLGTFQESQVIQLQAQSTSVIPISVAINPFNLYGSVQAAYSALINKTPLNITLNGSVYTSEGEIAIDKIIPVSL